MPADDWALIGTWKLKSVVREDAGTGERYDQLGAHPEGYLLRSFLHQKTPAQAPIKDSRGSLDADIKYPRS